MAAPENAASTKFTRFRILRHMEHFGELQSRIEALQSRIDASEEEEASLAAEATQLASDLLAAEARHRIHSLESLKLQSARIQDEVI